MNTNGEICIGIAGAGRAAELHLNALKYVGKIPYCLKHIIARREEQINTLKKRYNILNSSLSFEDLLTDPEIDIVDICTPPYTHTKMIEKAILAGKHVICEKPLSGYFGNSVSDELIGKSIPKATMYKELLSELKSLKKLIDSRSNQKFMYAENFLYSPSIIKAEEILLKKKSRILFAKGEESLKGSSSAVAGKWNKTGGGTFIRTGIHPLSAILWLKKIEGISRGVDISVESVYADMEKITSDLTKYEHRHINANPIDVEDIGTAIIKFTDKSRAIIIATDTLLGGSKNYVELYCNDSVLNCKLTMANLMETYFLDEDGLSDVDISEMLSNKMGWNYPFIDDINIRGYVGEMKDFLESVYYNHKPKSGFDIAYETIKIVYAAYKSAELRKPVRITN